MPILILIIAVVFFMWTGGAFIDETASHDPPQVRTITETKTVEVPGPTKTVTIRTELPESCKQSFQLAEAILDAAAKVDNKGSEQMNIVSDARVAIASQDTNQIIAVEDRQSKLLSATGGAILRLTELQLEFESARTQCTKEVQQ